MTSSLVGSDMCIRDRCLPLSRVPQKEFVELTHWRPEYGEYTKDQIVPVSYTHLTLPTICSV
eukprot:2343813-Prorocentrum_lima.AAC.1